MRFNSSTVTQRVSGTGGFQLRSGLGPRNTSPSQCCSLVLQVRYYGANEGAWRGDSKEAPLGSVLSHPPMSFVAETVGPKELKRVGNKGIFFQKVFQITVMGVGTL